MWAAVLFDLDDTLVDQRGAARSAVVWWARAHGIDDPADRLVERWTALSERHYRRYQDRQLTYLEQRRVRIRGRPSLTPPRRCDEPGTPVRPSPC